MRKYKTAEVYIGLIIAVGIFLMLASTVVVLIFNVYDLVIFNRVRTTARYLAEEKMETIKNAAYSDIGTTNGIPNGIFDQNETVIANGQSFNIYTRIDNIDDPYDGTGVADLDPADYKQIELQISWGGLASNAVNKVVLVSQISPINDTSGGGGTIDITVTDSNGDPVSLAEVSVVASSLVPPVNTTLFTDSNGKILVPGAVSCSACYEISATKVGYSTDRTYGTDELANPSKPDLTVADGQVSEVSFSIDLLSTLNITSTNSRDLNFTPLANQQFILRGSKTIGTDASSNIIYKYAEILNTDGSGTLTINNLEWDAYEIVIPTGVGWDISGVNPLQAFIVNPADNVNVTFANETGSAHRLLAIFKDGSQNPIASVAAMLKENSTSIEASKSSGLLDNPDYGQAFWGDLSNTTYTLYATASGFLEYVKEIVVNDYTTQEVILINE